MGHAYVVGTCDTKGAELKYVKAVIEAAGLGVRLLDVSPRLGDHGADVHAHEIAAHHPAGLAGVTRETERGAAISAMSLALQHYIRANLADIDGMIGIGGSGNTALVAPGLRELAIGKPKMVVSTVASGDVAPYVGPTDIAMVYSVVDVAGLNSISRRVLGNAANALAGALKFGLPVDPAADRPAVGMTMFGVTTPCVDRLVKALEDRYECYVFHATGTGGQTMEKLVDSGRIEGVIDVTTTEVADLLMGGVMSAGEDRLGAIARTRIPYVGSCGALDMVNFGGRSTVPAQYQSRLLYEHNAQVTLMRTTPEENRRMGEWIAGKLNACEGPVRFLIPEKGVSMIDVEGQAFYDAAADKALFDALRATLHQTPNRKLVLVPHALNDPEFAKALLDNFEEVMKGPAR